ncbi:alcohol oxidase [Daedaleopsis nitida]|nr:alcohol oxidase [Daedaleopsis nitida]
MYFLPFLLALLSSPAAVYVAGTTCNHPHGTTTAGEFSKIEFDYLIVGGGTAGVALSARLAANREAVVGVVEAGELRLNDPNIDIPGVIASSVVGNASYDWMFSSIPQTSAANRTVPLPRGKVLGGSSAINGLAWGRASSTEYDSWSEFGGPSWSWHGLLDDMRKSESLSKTQSNPYPGISRDAASQARKSLPFVDGFFGPIIASYNVFYFDIVSAMVRTMNKFGLHTNPIPQGGVATGVTNTLTTIDRLHGVRSYAASTYYCENAHRQNYHVLLNAQVTKILFSGSSGQIVATGVQYRSGEAIYSVTAHREVILSAGTYQTPQILELSGIGNKTILKKYGIKPLVDLPGVGENLQEHLFVGVQWKLKSGVGTFDILRNNATFAAEQAEQYAKNRTGLLTDTDSTVALMPLHNFVSDDRRKELLDILNQAPAFPPASLQRARYQIQQDWFATDTVAAVELIHLSRGFFPPLDDGASYATILGGIMHPASIGSVHIGSTDALMPPVIDPKFLSNSFDAQLLVDVIKFVQRLGSAAPFSSYVASQTDPAQSAAQSDEDLLQYVYSGSAVRMRTIALTAITMHFCLGVVDSSLKVYGTKNLRIVDASIFPIQIACHTQATVYAIAEKVCTSIYAWINMLMF